MYMNTTKDTPFSQELHTLEQHVLRVQLDHFRVPPEKRGRVFYALELMGEVGELLNDCKKFIRTNNVDRRMQQTESHIPEETADTLIALFLYKLSTGDNTRFSAAQRPTQSPGSVSELHLLLSSIATHAAAIYAEESALQARTTVPPFAATYSLSIISALYALAAYFSFDMTQIVHNKLEAIITKVHQGYYT